ncbi:MAG TPA: DUF5060 domain-containing protein [bacterium]|nr:DUF5060 domain-containing protein [bacterium]
MKRILPLLPVLLLLPLVACQSGRPPAVSGNLKKWHTITLTFTGPKCSEQSDPNPFLDYRFDVTFRKGDHAFTVPGYFAGDGDAGNSSAASGNKWRVHFCPDEEGEWSWYATFRKGKEAALSYEPESLPKAGWFDTAQGKFMVEASDKTGRDFRGKGRLEFYNQRYWRCAENGEYLLRMGAADDRFLAAADFDAVPASSGPGDARISGGEAHVQDWHPGDPVWHGERGKGAIGALNYLAAQGLNGLSVLTLDMTGANGQVFPYTGREERLRFDISRLDQWEIVMEHANSLGLVLQLRTQEGANQSLLDGGNLDTTRRLYYRILISRFAHHPGLIWDLGESTAAAPSPESAASRPQSADQRLDMAQYFYETDPYLHPLLFRNSGEFSELLTTGSKYTAALLRGPSQDLHTLVLQYRHIVDRRGLVWAVSALAALPGSTGTALANGAVDQLRREALWGPLMAGAAGVEWYAAADDGGTAAHLRDWRPFEPLWHDSRNALNFFRGLPFVEMENCDDLISSGTGYCLCKPGEIYALYLPKGGMVQLDLRGAAGRLEERWFDPRTGDFTGETEFVQGGGKKAIGPPGTPGKDWAVLLRAAAAL